MQSATNNFGWLIAEKVVRLVSSTLVGFWVARYLGPEGFGLLAYHLAYVGIGSAFVEFGLDGVVRREILRNPDATGRILATAKCLRLAAGLVAYTLFVGSVILTGSGIQEINLAALLGLLFFQPGLSVADLWLHAHLKARVVTLAQIPAIIFGSIVRVALILSGASLLAFAITMVAEMGVALTALNFFARRSGLRGVGRAEWQAFIMLVRSGWPLLISSLAIMVYLRIDALMLRYFLGESAVGMFVAATRISEASYFVPVFLASSVLPALLRAREQGNVVYLARLQQYYDGSAVLAYLFAGALIVLAPWLVPFAYGESYKAATSVLMVHALSQFGALMGVARGQFLVNEGYNRFYLCATLLGALVNVILNLWLIPRYGPFGAAWATVGAQAIAVWGSSFLWAPTRLTGRMQTKALLVPITGWRYFAR